MNARKFAFSWALHQYTLLIALVAALLIGFLAVREGLPSALTLPIALNWLACIIIFSLADLLAETVEEGLWFVYRYLAVMVAWVTLGTGLALSVMFVGVIVGFIVRINRGFSSSTASQLAIRRFAIIATGLLIACLFYTFLKDRTADVAGYGVSLVAGLVVANLTRSLLSLEHDKLLHTYWVMELLLLIVIPALVQTYLEAGVLSFLTLMGLVALQMLRYRQVNQTREALNLRTQEISALDAQLNLRTQENSVLDLDNAVLRDRSSEMAHNLSLINRTVQDVMFNLDDADAVKTACETAMQLTGAHKSAIFQRDSESGQQMFLSQAIGLSSAHEHYYEAHHYPSPIDLTAVRTIENIASLLPDDPLRILAKIGEFKSLVEIPLRSGSAPFGLLVIFHDQPHQYQKTEVELLETLSFQVAAALDNAELLKALELYASEQAQLVHLSRISTSSLKLETVLQSVSSLLQQMMGVEQVHVGLLQNHRERLRFFTSNGSDPHPQYPDLVIDDIPELAFICQQPQPSPRIFYHQDGNTSAGLAQLMENHHDVTLALVPMIANNDLLGIILLSHDEPRYFSDNEWRLAEMATNQIATQIHNAQQYNTTEDALNRRLRQLSAMEDIAQQISSSLDLDPLIHNVLEAAIHATQAELAALGLITESGEFRVIGREFVYSTWYKYDITRQTSAGLMGQVVQTGQMLVVPENQLAPDYIADAAQGTYRSSLLVPLVRNGVVVGALNVESTQHDFFKEEQIVFIQSLAGHAVIAIQNAQLLQERQSQIETLTSLRELSLQFSLTTDTKMVPSLILKTALNIMQGKSAVLLKYDAENTTLTLIEGLRRDDKHYISANPPIPASTALWAANTGKIQVVEDIHHDDDYLNTSPDTEINYRSLIVAPIKRGNLVQEVLCVGLPEHHVFTENDYNKIELLAIQTAGHLENNDLVERIRLGSNRMRAILDSTRDGIILLDRNGTLVDANASAEQLLGIDLEAYIGQNFAYTLMEGMSAGGVTEEGVQDALTDMARILRLEPRRITTRSTEIRKGAAVRYIDEVGSPVYDVHNPSLIIGRLLTLRDVTEERQLAAYRDEINKMVVHDLRSPLSNIISALNLSIDILLPDFEDHPTVPVLDTTLRTANESAEDLLDLVMSMLDIAKLEARKMDMNLMPASMKDLFKSIYIAMSPAMQEADVHMDIIASDNLPMVNIDADKIRRVLTNLLDNALRYTPTGTRILLSADCVNDKVLVQVADSGKGIPPEEHERIFEKFTQVKDTSPLRGHKGSGIGLAFCKLVIEAHHERIWVENESPLPGACFSFTLPIAPSA